MKISEIVEILEEWKDSINLPQKSFDNALIFILVSLARENNLTFDFLTPDKVWDFLKEKVTVEYSKEKNENRN